MKRMFLLFGATAVTLALSVAAASATTYQLTLGAGYAAASAVETSNAQSFLGTGSWYEKYPSAKTEMYLDVAASFGSGFSINQIASITYHTVAPVANPSGVDFGLYFYTTPFVGGDASWYGRRLTAEPYLSNGYVPQTPNVWNTWATGTGSNQLTFYDSNHSGNQGFYNAPTLADLQAGPVNWATWPGNPNAGSATGGPINYGTQTIKYLSIQTGSGWASFEGYVDAITVNLTTGNSYVINLEGPTDPLYVNGAWTGSGQGVEVAPGRFFGYNAFPKIQDAVNAAVPGGTIHVAGGTYTEQVVVNGKNVTIDGAGRASTTIQSPVTLTQFYTSSASNYPVVFCENASDVRVQNLTIDGAGRANGNYRMQGAGFWNAGGKLLNCDVVHIRETPFSGTQQGVGVGSYTSSGGPYSIEVGGCNISDFQKNAFAFNGANIVANVHDCTITGVGGTSTIAQNGVQIAFGASGTVSNVSVSGIFYTPNTTFGCALLAYLGGSVNVSNFTATNCQVGAFYEDMNGSVNGISVSGNATGVPGTGVIAYNDNASLAGSSLVHAAGRTVPSPSPFDGGTTGTLTRSPAHANSATMTVSVGPGCLTGDGLAGSIGVQFYSAGGPLSASASNLELSAWDHAFESGGTNVTANVGYNSITGSLSYGYFSDPGLANNAALNWWGASNGPGGAGPGSGNAVTADVAFTPWLISGSDGNAGCGFSPDPDNAITPGPAPSCLSIANSCITIPVKIARTTSDNVRGYSVTLQLSPNLLLCSGPSSITEGTYLNSVSGTNFQVVSNGGGSYTVDCAILGLPCGATASGGTLFNLAVTKAPGPDGTGFITINSTTLRDCDNGSVPSTAGAPLALTIDTAAPAAIANLSATQKKTGNDADGTTKIQLAFSAPGDAATVQVYRAGFGQYPEYDDAGGAVPAVPAYPPGAPWTLTGVTATGQYDEPSTRDFWYYVVFTKDACGNVSAVSNRTGGTLNYHLGDVSDGFTAGAGNNVVSTPDISLLGAHYGITLAPFDPFNYLDVGPTTDFSVNARPTTDNKVGFEDLILFAINYGVVSAPQNAVRPLSPSAVNAIAAEGAGSHKAGELFTVPVTFEGAGDVQGASVALAYDANAVEFVSAEAGELLQRQDRGSLVLSPAHGVVDFALLGGGNGVTGSGTLLNVTFRARTAGEASVAVATITARDVENHPVALAGGRTVVPAATSLGTAFPNPFAGGTRLDLALAREGIVHVAVYDLVGRHIRTLLDGIQPAGQQTIQWDGRDDGGRSLPAGLYMVRLEAPGTTMSRRLVRMP